MRLIWDKREFCFTFEKVSFDLYKKYKKVSAATLALKLTQFLHTPCYYVLVALCLPCSPISGAMARDYQPLPPLSWLEENLELTPDHPCGLKWKSSDRYHDAGEVAGKRYGTSHFYVVSLLGIRYPAHRVVYYLRTGEDPGDADVLHDKRNRERDNRLELTLYRRRTRPAPKYRRRVRNEEGQLVHRDPDMIYSFVQRNTNPEA